MVRWIDTKVVRDMETMKIVSRKGYFHSGPVESCDPITIGIISLIAGLGSTGVELGLQQSNKPSTPAPVTTPTTPPPPTAAQNLATMNAEKAALNPQALNIEAATSGLANPDYVSQISQLLAGTANQSGSSGAASDVVKQLFGLGGGSSTPNFTPAGTGGGGGSNAPINLSDFANEFMLKG